MIARFFLALFFLGFSFQAFAEQSSNLLLTPQEGRHQFDFFDFPTPVWSYNNRIPGPVIRAKEGTLLSIDVFNKLKEPTSIHWHGLRIENAMDGVPGVTQDPIPSGGRFEYRLHLQEAGTYWYHPHFNAGEQLERGLKGALIVEERNKLPWSQDVIWLLDDWRFRQDGKIFPFFNTHPDLMHDGRWGNAITVNGQSDPEISVSPGQRIRLRLINGANARVFSNSLIGLDANIIAVDGRPVTIIFPFKNFILAPGNRVDLDIKVPASAAGKIFYLEDRFTRKPIVLGKIRVDNVSPVDPPSFEIPLAGDFIPERLFSSLPVSKTWELNAIRGGKFGIGWAMNRLLWPDADKVDFEIGKPVKVEFINSSSRLHPMHIHGAFFRVLEINGRSAAEPFTRDTVLVGPRQAVVIGLIPDHEGIWLSHCHIQTHAEAGMMTTIKVE